RLSRRISNVFLISVLSVGAAFLITRQPSTGFSVPQGSSALLPTQPSASTQSLAPGAENAAVAYKSQPGPYSVGELPD
ncbi:hypothetical protein, partial [Klebsiella pneumoniae]|uniref:hypothetical protein n=1 Tax=Klebsiella pneumoniae TaxID=573 RepID=UPI003013934E